MKSCRRGFGQEMRVGTILKAQLGKKHRAERERVWAMLAGEMDQETSLAAGVAALRRRSEQNAAC